MKDKYKILFVCLGNICRSPAAEGIMANMISDNGLGDKIEVDSAGTYGGHSGELADPRMRSAAMNRGYNLTSRSRQIRGDDFDKFDMIVVMDDSNYERVNRLAPDNKARNKIFRMVEFLEHYKADHIPDPYYDGAAGFKKVLDLLEDACGGLLNRVKGEIAG